MLRDRGRYEKGMYNIKNVMKFAFSTTILLRGIGTGMMGKGAIRIQIGEEKFIIVFLGIVWPEDLNSARKLSLNHFVESLQDKNKVRAMF